MSSYPRIFPLPLSLGVSLTLCLDATPQVLQGCRGPRVQGWAGGGRKGGGWAVDGRWMDGVSLCNNDGTRDGGRKLGGWRTGNLPTAMRLVVCGEIVLSLVAVGGVGREVKEGEEKNEMPLVCREWGPEGDERQDACCATYPASWTRRSGPCLFGSSPARAPPLGCAPRCLEAYAEYPLPLPAARPRTP